LALFSRRTHKKSNAFKVFFASDLHGSERCFIKFVNAAKHYGADALICGGDLTGKMIVPLVEDGSGSVSATVMGEPVTAGTPEEIAALEKRLAAGGFYPYRTDDASVRDLDDAGIERLFEGVIRDRLQRWVDLAEERLAGTETQFFWMAGNDDQPFIDEVLSGSERLMFSDGRKVALREGWEMITLGLANETPWQCPRDVAEDELARQIDGVVADVEDFDRCIFNIHVPPHGTQLDQAPDLDEELRPRMEGGGLRIANVGSVAVREAIERYGPALGLHGHIHESGGIDRLGRTVCINPGSDYQEGVLRGALIVLDTDGGVRDWALTAG
jgi:Icc-related predicted phosphoesterase